MNQNLQPADVQQIEISDSQIVKEGYKPRLTVNFKTSLGLRGGLVTKEIFGWFRPIQMAPWFFMMLNFTLIRQVP